MRLSVVIDRNYMTAVIIFRVAAWTRGGITALLESMEGDGFSPGCPHDLEHLHF